MNRQKSAAAIVVPRERDEGPNVKYGSKRADLDAGQAEAHGSAARSEAVRKVEIPKPQGGVRALGIPTVLDRLIQQALNQVLRQLFDPEFSVSSYGFRPGRNAHQAVRAAQGYVAEGKRWVVYLDLEKFFDRVNHDVLMARAARKVEDERVLKLIRRYLEAGLPTNLKCNLRCAQQSRGL